MTRPTTLGSALVLALFIGVGPAHATFPGMDGRIAYTGIYDNQLLLTGTGPLVPLPSGMYDYSPAFSPDGTKVAFIRLSFPNLVYTYQVMVVNSDGSGLHAVASSTMFGVNL